MEQIFKLGGLLVLPFWLLMIVLPRWRWTERIMESPLVVLGPTILYVVLVVPRLPEIFPALLKPELPAIAALLGSPAGATIGWMHFLAFDLFVGRWIYLDSRQRGITSWLMGPLLFVTLMIGPCGLLIHLGIRQVFSTLQTTSHNSPDGK